MLLGTDRQRAGTISKPKCNIRRNGSTSSIKYAFTDNIQAREEEIRKIEDRKSKAGLIMTPLFLLPQEENNKSTNKLLPESRRLATLNDDLVVIQSKKPISRDSNVIEIKECLVEKFIKIEEQQNMKTKEQKLLTDSNTTDSQIKRGHTRSISDTSIFVPVN